MNTPSSDLDLCRIQPEQGLLTDCPSFADGQWKSRGEGRSWSLRRRWRKIRAGPFFFLWARKRCQVEIASTHNRAARLVRRGLFSLSLLPAIDRQSLQVSVELVRDPVLRHTRRGTIWSIRAGPMRRETHTKKQTNAGADDGGRKSEQRRGRNATERCRGTEIASRAIRTCDDSPAGPHTRQRSLSIASHARGTFHALLPAVWKVRKAAGFPLACRRRLLPTAPH